MNLNLGISFVGDLLLKKMASKRVACMQPALALLYTFETDVEGAGRTTAITNETIMTD
jgi:hypothetical protein